MTVQLAASACRVSMFDPLFDPLLASLLAVVVVRLATIRLLRAVRDRRVDGARAARTAQIEEFLPALVVLGFFAFDGLVRDGVLTTPATGAGCGVWNAPWPVGSGSSTRWRTPPASKSFGSSASFWPASGSASG